MSNRRPTTVSLLAVMSAVAGLLMFLGGIVFVKNDPWLIYQGGSAVGIGISYLIAAGSNWVIAAGFWRLWTPIRAFALGFAFISLIVVIPLLLLDYANVALGAEALAGAAVLVAFLESGIREAFDPPLPPIIESQSHYPDMRDSI